MTKPQVELRRSLQIFLKSEDWDLTDTNWFEEDLWSQYELSPLYDNQKMTIELELSIPKASLNLILTDNNTGDEIFIVIKSLDDIAFAFRTINDFKNTIDSANFREHINRLFDVTKAVFVDDGSNLVELSPNK